jgi:hypothetical protein
LNFLHSAILYALAAATLPLLIHLLTRSRSRVIVFSTLRFLKELQKNKLSRLKLRQFLLLLLRTLIIIFVVLAFARPTCRRSDAGGAAGARTSAVIILDNSYSMARQAQGQSLYELAGKAVTQMLPLFQEGDELFLVSSTDTLAEQARLAFHTPEKVQQAISQWSLDARATDFNASIRFGDRILRQTKNVNKELYLIADMQRSGFGNDSLPRPSASIRRFALPILAKTIGNLSCDLVKLKSTILQKDHVLEGEAIIHNTGNLAQNKLLQIFINQKQVAQSTVQVDPGGSVTVPWRCVLEQAGFMSGYGLLEDDDWLQDNRFYFSFYVPDRIRTGLLGAETPDGYFLQLALQPNRQTTFLYDVIPIPADQLAFQRMDDLDVLVLCNVKSLSIVAIEWLENFCNHGKGVVFILGPQVDMAAYNREFHQRLGLPLLRDVMGSLRPPQPTFTLGSADLQHPLFEGLFETPAARFGDPAFHWALRIVPSDAMTTIIPFSSGDPFLFEWQHASARFLAFTSGFQEEVSDLAYRAIFAPLLHRSISFVHSKSKGNFDSLYTGDRLRFQVPSELLATTLTLQRPDQRSERLTAVSLGATGHWVIYSATDCPGIYQLTAPQNTLTQWAVNIPASERDIRPLDNAPLEKRFAMRVLEPSTSLAQTIREQRSGKELWSYFIWAALLLLCVEMFLYYEKGEALTKGSNE